MDLDVGERYAAAALFTLALHTTQVETGVDEAGSPLATFKSAWGCPDEELFDDLICVPEDEPWPGMEVPNGFWGFDCCAPQGLCRRVYRALGIAESRWPGLLKMPDVSSAANANEARAALVKLVRRYGAFLDPAVAPLIRRALSVHWGDGDAAGGDAAGGDAAGGDAAGDAGGEADGEADGEEQWRPEGASAGAGAGGAQLGAKEGTEAEGAAGGLAPQPREAAPPVPDEEPPEPPPLSSAAVAVAAQEEQGGEEEVVVEEEPLRGQHAAAAGEPSAGQKCPSDAAMAAAALTAAAVGGLEASSRVLGPDSAAVDDPEGGGEQLARGGSGGSREDEGGGGDGDADADSAALPVAVSCRHDPTHQSVLALYELIGACLRAAAAAAADGDARDSGGEGGGGGGDSAAAAGFSAEATPAEGAAPGADGAAVAAANSSAAQLQPQASAGTGAEGAKGRTSGRLSSFFSGTLLGGGGGRTGAGKAAGGAAAAEGVVRVVRRPLVRWYDARARVALRRFCHWLRIPAPKMHAMEQMWALQMLQLNADGGFDFGRASAGADGAAVASGGGGGRYVTYLKVSAGALGGAALLALTGGLAAPAIAAGLGSAIMVFGGGTAAATAVTALGGTAAGTAAITGTFGVIGASHAGSKTAALYGEVREFGFWSISAPFILPPPPSAADDPEDPTAADTAAATDATAAAGGGGGALSSLSSLFRWRSKDASSTAAATTTAAEPGGGGDGGGGGLGESTSAPQPPQPQAPAGQAGQATLPQHLSLQPLRTPLDLQQQEGGGAGRAHTGSGALPRGGGGSEEGAPAASAAPPLPPLAPARPSQGSSGLSHDGLFVPAQLLGDGSGEGSGAGGGGSGGGSLDPSHPAAMFRHAPVTPYPPPPPPEAAAAAAVASSSSSSSSAGSPGPCNATAAPASDGPGGLAVAESAGPGRVSGDGGSGDGGSGGNSNLNGGNSNLTGDLRRLAAHPLETSPSPSEGGWISGAEGSCGGAAAAAGGGGVGNPRVASSGGAAPPPPPPKTAADGGAASGGGNAADNKGPMDASVDGKQSQSGSDVSVRSVGAPLSADGDDDGSDPWAAELAASDRAAAVAAARARAARAAGAADGAYVEALLAELDAEVADLDGDGGAAAARGRTTAEAGAAAAATGGGGGGSSRWSRWFRSSSGNPAETEEEKEKKQGKGRERAKAGQLRPLLPLPVNPRRSGDATLALTIAVNGWVKQPEDFVSPWRPLPSGGRELWGLVWESDVLQSLGGALRRLIRDKAIEESSKMVLRLGVSTALVTAMMLPMAVMSAINLTIGSRWRVALRRAQLGGRCLAHLLMQGGHGDRPVTLIGFSIGARLIFHCLLELSRCGAAGLVESAILLGAPVSANAERWAAARRAVAGRLVNAFSANDWVLGVVFRAHSRGSLVAPAAGLAPVAVGGVENINLSSLIGGHTQYLDKMEEVLCALNLAEH